MTSTTSTTGWAAPSAVREKASAEKTPSRFSFGPHEVVHAFWLAGMSCDGC